MNIFASLRVYAGKWNEVACRVFDPAEIDAVSQATVVESQYGYSVCFLMKAGGQTYIPLDTNSSLGIGDVVDLKTAKLVTLHKEGEKDIYRVRA